MAELFSANDIGTVPEDRWREWVDGINGIGFFTQSGIPDQKLYATWQEWAEQMVGVMNLQA
jgi:hypothetical protein